ADDVRPPDAEVVEQPDDVESHLAAVLGGLGRLVALAVAAEVARDDANGAREVLRDSAGPPDVGRVREAVDEDDRIALALLDVTQPNAADVEVIVLGGADAGDDRQGNGGGDHNPLHTAHTRT